MADQLGDQVDMNSLPDIVPANSDPDGIDVSTEPVGDVKTVDEVGAELEAQVVAEEKRWADKYVSPEEMEKGYIDQSKLIGQKATELEMARKQLELSQQQSEMLMQQMQQHYQQMQQANAPIPPSLEEQFKEIQDAVDRGDMEMPQAMATWRNNFLSQAELMMNAKVQDVHQSLAEQQAIAKWKNENPNFEKYWAQGLIQAKVSQNPAIEDNYSAFYAVERDMERLTKAKDIEDAKKTALSEFQKLIKGGEAAKKTALGAPGETIRETTPKTPKSDADREDSMLKAALAAGR